MHISKRQKAMLAIIAANIIWGAAPPIFKWSLDSIQPLTLGFLRFFLASILILPAAWKYIGIKKKDILLIILVAFFSVPLHIGFFLIGLQFGSSINVPIIGSSAPIFLLIGSSLFLHQRHKKKVIVGTIISLFGVLVIIMRPILENSFDISILGNIFFLLSTITGCVHLFLLRKIIRSYSSVVVTFWTFFIGQLFFLPLFLWEVTQPNYLFSLNVHSIIGILFGTIFSSGLGWLFLAYASERLAPTEIGLFGYLGPIVTALVALPLLGEQITFSYLLGALFVFSGIFVAEGRYTFHPMHK